MMIFRPFVPFYGSARPRTVCWSTTKAPQSYRSIQRRVRQSSSTATVSEHPAMSSEVTNEPVRYRVHHHATPF